MSIEKLNFLTARKRAYQITFARDNPASNLVLKDLAKFCRANATTFHPDDRMHAVLEGRREVWLRLQQHLQLSPDELLKLLGG